MPLSNRLIRPLLASVATWSLADDEWSTVNATLAALGEAVRAGDDGRAGREAARLAEYGGAVRIGRRIDAGLGDPAAHGADEETRSLINDLVHRLTTEPAEPDHAEPA
ncbi:CATRA system-associated protein [Dactylosporangium sp. NPDC049140]|uniref:CATRA system-associated protein n=1 Tax=Dactylosporangium sp. NPDC049140 TaxID=3155647 RepID=UPI0034017B63